MMMEGQSEDQIDAVEKKLTEEMANLRAETQLIHALSDRAAEWISDREDARKEDLKAIRQYVLLALAGVLLSMASVGVSHFIEQNANSEKLQNTNNF